MGVAVEFQYENAPITEALIDIRIGGAPPSTLQKLESIHELVKTEYPEKKRRVHLESELVGAEVEATTMTRQRMLGFAFTSEDGKQIFQARLDGFTFSRLRPYGNWRTLRDEARRLWSIYRSAIEPEKVTRVAVRYINQIDLPFRSQLDYKDYFQTIPEVSPSLPQGLGGFFMRLNMPQPDLGGMLILTQGTVEPPNQETHSVVLDLDVFKEVPRFSSDEEIWQTLQVLRSRKNEYFEGSLTQRAKALFGEKRYYSDDNGN